jgi:hypothetical protein
MRWALKIESKNRPHPQEAGDGFKTAPPVRADGRLFAEEAKIDGPLERRADEAAKSEVHGGGDRSKKRADRGGSTSAPLASVSS